MPRGCVDQQHHRLTRPHLQLPRQALPQHHMTMIASRQAAPVFNTQGAVIQHIARRVYPLAHERQGELTKADQAIQ